METATTSGVRTDDSVKVVLEGRITAYTAAPIWKDSAAEKGKTSYYYGRGEKSDGEIVWVSPMWVTYTGQ